MKRLLVLACCLACVSSLYAVVTPGGLWEFNNAANLSQATIGNDLTLVGVDNAIAGVNPGDGAAIIGVGSHYICDHGMPITAGSEYLSDWTLMMDIQMPLQSLGSYLTLFQTNTGNANDGDLFIKNSTQAIGTAETGYTANSLMADTWYRVVVSSKLNGTFDIYVDGVNWLSSTTATAKRYGLDPQILFFADNDGDDADILVSSIAMWDSTLDAADVQSLGFAGSAVPEPATLSLLGIGLLGLVRRNRK